MNAHRFKSLLRIGSPHLRLGVRIEGGDLPIEYKFSIASDGRRVAIEEETLDLGPSSGYSEPLHLIMRDSSGARIFDKAQGKPVSTPSDPSQLLLGSVGFLQPPNEAFVRTREALSNIEVHLPFDVLPIWAESERARDSIVRSSARFQPATSLARLGANLINVYHALKNDYGERHWRETMEIVRLGLGEAIESINIRHDPSGDAAALWVKYSGVSEQVPASGLSDGEIIYLAFVALSRLPAARSLLAVDEPDLHLHPALLMRVLDLLEDMARGHPVLVTTHSDRLLDGLRDPAQAVVLTELNDARATRLVRPDPAALQEWLETYRGLGDVRSAGHESSVMTRRECP